MSKGNLGWTGKESIRKQISDYQDCCHICQLESAYDPPCIGWVYNDDGSCYQKYDIGDDYNPIVRQNQNTNAAGWFKTTRK